MSHVPGFLSRIAQSKTALLGGAAALMVTGLAVLASRAHSQATDARAPSPAVAAAASGAAFSDDQKKEIGEIVKDYLVKHPEVLSDAQNALEAKMEKEQADTFPGGRVSHSASRVPGSSRRRQMAPRGWSLQLRGPPVPAVRLPLCVRLPPPRSYR